jgi:hypothetical protein
VQVLTGFGGDAEAVEALVCKTGLSGFESHRYLHFLLRVELLLGGTELRAEARRLISAVRKTSRLSPGFPPDS